jgi:hypothetical protein
MDRITISNKQVKEIRHDGIVYLDDNGVEQFIDFEQCYQNYLARRLSPEAIESFKLHNNKTDADVPKHIERTKAWKEVARRNVIGLDFVNGIRGLPYFDFYTMPSVRIEIENEDQWQEMRHKIEHDFHWRTFDMT